MRFLTTLLIGVFTPLLLIVEPALAAETAGAAGGILSDGAAAAIGLGIAAAAGALAQGKVGASVMDAISRNPGASGQLFTPFLLGLVFIESIVLVIAIVVKVL